MAFALQILKSIESDVIWVTIHLGSILHLHLVAKEIYVTMEEY